MDTLRAHPDYRNPPVPRQVTVGAMKLEVLGPDIVEEDFDAVMGSADRLTGLFGGTWPAGLTLEENAIDLAWHLREFETARSFAWVIRGEDRRYLGCCYLFPTLGERGAANAWVWFCADVMDAKAEAERSAELLAWLRELAPQGSRIDLHVPGDA